MCNSAAKTWLLSCMSSHQMLAWDKFSSSGVCLAVGERAPLLATESKAWPTLRTTNRPPTVRVNGKLSLMLLTASSWSSE